MDMGPVTYESKDVMPTVLNVLCYIACDIRSTIFKLSLDNQYADLKELVDPEDTGQETGDLIELLDDPLSLILKSFYDKVLLIYDLLAIIHDIDQMEIYQDERLAKLADNIYDATVYYRDGMHEDNLINMELYLFSLPAVIDPLRDLIVNQQFDEEQLRDWFELDEEYFDVYEQSEVPTIRILAGLVMKVFECQRKIAGVLH